MKNQTQAKTIPSLDYFNTCRNCGHSCHCSNSSKCHCACAVCEHYDHASDSDIPVKYPG